MRHAAYPAHREGAVRVEFNGTTLQGHFVVDDAVITVDHIMLGAKSARLEGAPADAVAKILLCELAFARLHGID